MEAIKTVLKIIIFFFVSLKHDASAQPSLENQMYFKKMYNHGNSLKEEEVVSSYSVHSQVDCSLKCREEQFCVGYNYRLKSRAGEINCQTGHNTTLKRDAESVVNGEWIFYQNLDYLPVSIELVSI